MNWDGGLLAHPFWRIIMDSTWSVEIEAHGDYVDAINHFLIVEAPAAVFEIRTTVLKEHNDDFRRRVDELEESFAVKK